MTPQAAALHAALPTSQTATLSAAGARAPGSDVAQEFEAVFLHTMIDTMFKTIEGGGTFGDSNAAETWRGMLSEQYAASIVEAGGIGMAQAVQRELIAIQEGI